MSGGPPHNNYGFTAGPPYYPGSTPASVPAAPPNHFPSAPYPGVPVTNVQHPGAPPTYFHPPQYFPLTNTVSNYYPPGETHFTSSFVPQSNAQNLSQGPRWVQWHIGNMLPAHAVEGGYDVDRTKIYVGRLNHKGDLLPAKVIPQKNVAYVSYNGIEIAFQSCEVLCQQYVNWSRVSNGRIPPGAIAVGRTSSGETLYAGRVDHQGSRVVGKVHPSHGVCYIPFGGKEIAHHEYEVLTS